MIIRHQVFEAGRGSRPGVVLRCDSCACDAPRGGSTVVMATARAVDDGWSATPDREGCLVHLCRTCARPRGAA